MSYNNISSLEERHVEELHALYQQEWWTRGRTVEEVRLMAARSEYLYGICDEDSALVGFARVLSDGVFKALIFDVIVHPEHRGHKLGARLMERIVDDPRLSRVRHFELYCLPELEPFYAGIGFTAEVGGVRLMRRERYSS